MKYFFVFVNKTNWTNKTTLNLKRNPNYWTLVDMNELLYYVILPIYLYGSLQSLWNFVHIASSGQTILVVTARQSRRNRSWIELRMLYVLYVLNWINVRVWLGRTKSVLEKFYLLIICGWEKNFNSWAMNFQLPLLDIAEFEDCVMLFGLPTNKFWSSFWCKECRLLPLNSLEEQDTQC